MTVTEVPDSVYDAMGMWIEPESMPRRSEDVAARIPTSQGARLLNWKLETG
jgi:hypothetical protein